MAIFGSQKKPRSIASSGLRLISYKEDELKMNLTEEIFTIAESLNFITENLSMHCVATLLVILLESLIGRLALDSQIANYFSGSPASVHLVAVKQSQRVHWNVMKKASMKI